MKSSANLEMLMIIIHLVMVLRISISFESSRCIYSSECDTELNDFSLISMFLK